MYKQWRSTYVLVVVVVYLCVCVVDIACNELPGEEHVYVRAASSQYPYIYPLDDSPRAFIELQMSVYASTPSCYHQTDSNNFTTGIILAALQQEGDNSVWYNVGDPWIIQLSDITFSDIHEWDVYDIDRQVYKSDSHLRLMISSTCEAPTSFQFALIQMGYLGRFQVAIGAVLLILVYVLIITEMIHRTISAMLGAFAILLVLTFLRERPPIDVVIGWIDESTIGLLLGMMIIIAVFSKTGFFEWGAVQAFKLSKGKVWRLLAILCALTAVLSAFLDNVTTMLLVAPVTLRLSTVVNLPPAPLLLSEVFFCNMGGAATMIGDPPNIIMGSMLSEHIAFIDFIINLAPGIILACPVVFLLIRFLYRKELVDRPYYSSVVEDLDRDYVIYDMKLFIKVSVVLLIVIAAFFTERVTHIEPAWAALGGAAILLLIARRHEIDAVLEKVEWSTLLFFAGLFILVEGLKEMGLIRFIGDSVGHLVSLASQENRLLVALLIIIWVSGIASAFIDNIPYTTTMIPVIIQLANEPELNLPLLPLAWALSFGACLGGNGTLIGASANVVTVGISQQAGFIITFRQFMVVGFPVMIVSLMVCTLYMLVVYVWLGWGHGTA